MKRTVILVLLSVLVSCSKETFENDELSKQGYEKVVDKYSEFDNKINEIALINAKEEELASVVHSVTSSFTMLKEREELEVLSETQAKMMLSPLIGKTTDLLNAYGITEMEIIEEMGSLHDERLALVGLVLDEIKKAEELSPESAYAYLESAKDCMLITLGLDSVRGVYDSFTRGGASRAFAKNAFKQGARIVMKNVATKLIGPVGIAVSAVEFSYCMYKKSDCDYIYSPSTTPITIKYGELARKFPITELISIEDELDIKGTKTAYYVKKDEDNPNFLYLYKIIDEKPVGYKYTPEEVVTIQYVRTDNAQNWN